MVRSAPGLISLEPSSGARSTRILRCRATQRVFTLIWNSPFAADLARPSGNQPPRILRCTSSVRVPPLTFPFTTYRRPCRTFARGQRTRRFVTSAVAAADAASPVGDVPAYAVAGTAGSPTRETRAQGAGVSVQE
jgi:hypothetical protein